MLRDGLPSSGRCNYRTDISGLEAEGVLGEQGPAYYSHTLTLYQEFIRIPLLIYDPLDQRQGDVKFGRQIDVAPTVLESPGLSIPPSWQGAVLVATEHHLIQFP